MSNLDRTQMAVVISSAIAGFRRAGCSHPMEPTTHAPGTFTSAQLDQLDAEPRLTVSYLEPDKALAPAAGDDPQGQLDGREVDLASLTADQLRGMAELGEINGYKTMKKAELIAAIEAACEDLEVVLDEAE